MPGGGTLEWLRYETGTRTPVRVPFVFFYRRLDYLGNGDLRQLGSRSAAVARLATLH